MRIEQKKDITNVITPIINTTNQETKPVRDLKNINHNHYVSTQEKNGSLGSICEHEKKMHGALELRDRDSNSLRVTVADAHADMLDTCLLGGGGGGTTELKIC